ncbi:MAG: type II secretion system F family protein [Alphaproteobacteria bacterium]|nr:MAG: type II secretion system F family protein [Alphaproteobacteria bacterium]
MSDIFANLGSDLLAALAAAGAFITAIWVGNSFIQRDTMSSRVKALEERRKALQAGLRTTKRRKDHKAAQSSMGAMRQVVQRLQLLRSQEAEKISIKMMRAGWRSRDAVVIFFFAKLCLPILSGIGAILIFYVFGKPDMTTTKKAMYAIGMVLAGSYAPELILKNFGDKRKAKLRDGLPDSLDLLVICAEAGLSMDASLTRVARELGPAYPELSEELGLTAIELNFLPERATALDNLALRVDLSGVKALVGTLQQTEKYGTPLAQALRVLSGEFRNERLMKAEEKAARLPAIMTLPMVIFILPPLFIVLLGPAIIRTLDAIKNMH